MKATLLRGNLIEPGAFACRIPLTAVELSFQPVIAAVSAAQHILIVSHDRPDGDAIGSAVGLGLILEGIGKKVQVVNRDPVPDGLAFLPEVSRVVSPESIAEPDLVMALDSAGRDRISSEVWAKIDETIPVVNMDHHVSNPGFGTVNYVDTVSPATGQIIAQLAESAGWVVSAEAANLLYAAISTDTGSFRYPATSAETMRIGAKLIDLGVEVGQINQQLYESYPLRRVEALSYLLEGLKLDCEGRCASVQLPFSITRELGLRSGDTEGVIDVIRAIDTVIVAVLFEEFPDGRIRVSSRSKRADVSVGEICEVFGGGGHTLAAGARLPGPLEEAAERFLEQVRQKITQIKDCQNSGK